LEVKLYIKKEIIKDRKRRDVLASKKCITTTKYYENYVKKK
jgi:hypothetical protein